MELKTGISNSKTVTVNKSNVASSAGSGLLDVFATPCMCALMEQAAGELVQPYLEEGKFTVGTALDITHTAATPIGMKVTATAVLDKIDRRALYFTVTAEDECEVIGKGTHTRFIVDEARFMTKVNQKLK